MTLSEPKPLAALRLPPDNDVAVCVRALEAGETPLDGVVVREPRHLGDHRGRDRTHDGDGRSRQCLDFGEILSAGVSIPEMGERIFELMIRTASGQPSRSEALGFGEDEIQP